MPISVISCCCACSFIFKSNSKRGGDKYIGANEYSLNLLDTTNTTAQVDYKTVTNAETGMITNPDDSSSYHRGEASMILMEILG